MDQRARNPSQRNERDNCVLDSPQHHCVPQNPPHIAPPFQGITLDKATIDIGNKDFSSGLSFVAISRVKTLRGIAFRKSFGWAMLEYDTVHRTALGFELDTYGMDLREYVFNED